MKREDLFESIDNQILSEKIYRAKIRNTINKYNTLLEEKKKKEIIIEKIYRLKTRKEIKNLFEKKVNMVHASTGMNALEDLFSNSNILSVLESDYKMLTTSFEQRTDYRGHIMSKVLDMFKIEDIGSEKDENLNESLQYLFEQEADIQITVDDDDLPEDKMVGPARDEKEEEQGKEDDENADSIDPNIDATGRNKAITSFSKIENNISNIYNTLGNPADKYEFKKFLIANLNMYFDRFEKSLSNDPEPEIPQDSLDAVEDAEAKLDQSGEDISGAEEVDGTEEEDGLGLDL